MELCELDIIWIHEVGILNLLFNHTKIWLRGNFVRVDDKTIMVSVNDNLGFDALKSSIDVGNIFAQQWSNVSDVVSFPRNNHLFVRWALSGHINVRF